MISAFLFSSKPPAKTAEIKNVNSGFTYTSLITTLPEALGGGSERQRMRCFVQRDVRPTIQEFLEGGMQEIHCIIRFRA